MNPYQNHTDTELLDLLKEGDRIAFAEIYARYAASLYRYARKNISTKEECEEIVQEIFESLWVRREGLQIQNLGSYLIKMVRYKVIHHFRHSAVKRKFAEHYRLFETLYETGSDTEGNPEIIESRLIESISRLPEKWQTALRLRLYENLSNSDIAKRMNISKKTVEWYMFEAFARIRESYKI